MHPKISKAEISALFYQDFYKTKNGKNNLLYYMYKVRIRQLDFKEFVKLKFSDLKSENLNWL